MKTFGEQAELILEGERYQKTINWFGRNLGIQDKTRTTYPFNKMFRTTVFDIDKLYFVNIEQTGLSRAIEPDDAIRRFQRYCADINKLTTILKPYIFYGLPTDRVTPFGTLDWTNGKYTFVQTKEILGSLKARRIELQKLQNLSKYRRMRKGEKDKFAQEFQKITNEENKIKEEIKLFNTYGKKTKKPLAGTTTGYFTEDCQLYITSVAPFIERISTLAQQLSRRGWKDGFSLDTIFTGYVGAGYVRTKEKLHKSDMPDTTFGGVQLDPESKQEVSFTDQNKIHNTIIMDAFLKPKQLLYLTHQEYDYVKNSSGFLQMLGRGFNSVVKGLYSAGAGAPKTRV